MTFLDLAGRNAFDFPNVCLARMVRVLDVRISCATCDKLQFVLNPCLEGEYRWLTRMRLKDDDHVDFGLLPFHTSWMVYGRWIARKFAICS